MSAVGPTLETARLILRPPMAEDFGRFAEMMADAEVTRYLGGPQSRAVAWRAFSCMAGSWVLHGFSMFSVIEKSSGLWVGRVGPWRPEGWPGDEVGWALHRDGWGKGYVVEAATASMDWAFDHLGWTDIIHSITPPNVRSVATAERLGSVNRGPVRMPEPHHEVPVEAWGQTRQQWRARRA